MIRWHGILCKSWMQVHVPHLNTNANLFFYVIDTMPNGDIFLVIFCQRMLSWCRCRCVSHDIGLLAPSSWFTVQLWWTLSWNMNLRTTLDFPDDSSPTPAILHKWLRGSGGQAGGDDGPSRIDGNCEPGRTRICFTLLAMLKAPFLDILSLRCHAVLWPLIRMITLQACLLTLTRTFHGMVSYGMGDGRLGQGWAGLGHAGAW